MEQTDTTTSESSGKTRQSQELIRPTEDRMLAGVAQGFARNFDIHPWIPRVFFIVTAFMGGLGVALYAAGWAFIRSEDETESPAERVFSGEFNSRSWLGIGLIVVAGMIILSQFTFLAGEVIWAAALLVVGLLLYLGYIPGLERSEPEGSAESKEGVQQMTTTDTTTTKRLVDEPSGDSPAGGSPTPQPPSTPTPPDLPPAPPTPTPPDLPPAPPREHSILGRLTIGITLLALGVLAILDNIDSLSIDAAPYHYLALAVTIVGVGLIVGAFAGRARWLILLLVFMVPTLIFSPFFGGDWRRERFDLFVEPQTFSELDLDNSYEVNFGELIVDLTDLPWDGEEVELNADVNVGHLVIRIPETVGIVGSANASIGQVSGRHRVSNGIGDLELNWNAPGPDGTVFLDAEVGIGAIDIERTNGD